MNLEQYGGYIIKIFVSVLCGGVIGLERELSGKSAGLKTNILICMGAAIYMIVSNLIPIVTGVVPADPGRIAAQVATGIGFIGAGCIIHSGMSIAGLTTAATIWVVAAIGLVIGLGFNILAIILTAIVLLILIGVGRLERILRIHRKENSNEKDAPPPIDD